MDRDEKIMMFLSALGDGADPDVARAMLEAHDWDLEVAINNVLGDAPRAAVPPAAPVRVDSEGYREQMRTGYMDTLAAPITQQELDRQAAERAERAEQARLAAQAAAQAVRDAENEEAAKRYRAEAERQALERANERKRQARAAAAATANPADAERAEVERRQREEQAAKAQRQEAELQAQQAQKAEQERQALQAAEAARAQKASEQLAAQQAEQDAEARRLAAREADELQRERDEAALRAQVPRLERTLSDQRRVDELVQALTALKGRYIATDPAGLATCLQTLRTYINNLARSPCEVKFQRINCDNNAFRTRVGAYDGAVAVLLACGFKDDSGVLMVDADFAKSKGPKLWDALAKVDVMLEQAKSAA